MGLAGRCRRRGASRNDADLERVAGVHLGPVQDQDHLACRGDRRRQCFPFRAAEETVVFGQGAKAASSPRHTEAVSIGSRVCNHRSRSPRANLQRRRCHGHAHWGRRRPIDSLHCVNAGPRQAWFVCVQTVPCSTVSKRRKGGNCCCGSGVVKKWIGARCERNTETKENAKNVMNQSRLLHSRLADGNAQMRREYAKNAFVGTLRRRFRGNAWHARPGNRKMHSRQNMQAHKPHSIVFVRRARVQYAQGRNEIFCRHVETGTQRRQSVLGFCSEKAWGWSRCSICHVKQAAFAFKPWLAQHLSCMFLQW